MSWVIMIMFRLEIGSRTRLKAFARARASVYAMRTYLKSEAGCLGSCVAWP